MNMKLGYNEHVGLTKHCITSSVSTQSKAQKLIYISILCKVNKHKQRITNLWRIKFCSKVAEFGMSFSIILEKCFLILSIFLSKHLQSTCNASKKTLQHICMSQWKSSHGFTLNDESSNRTASVGNTSKSSSLLCLISWQSNHHQQKGDFLMYIKTLWFSNLKVGIIKLQPLHCPGLSSRCSGPIFLS